MIQRPRTTLLVLAALFLSACGGSSAPTDHGDACAQEISDAYTNYGTPDSRTDNGTETDLFWGRIKREYIRQGPNTCFVSNPITT